MAIGPLRNISRISTGTPITFAVNPRGGERPADTRGFPDRALARASFLARAGSSPVEAPYRPRMVASLTL
jgi:hypothetical protein